MEKKVYTVSEVAEMLGISKSFAYEMVKRGTIPVMEIGSRKVIPKQRFEQCLNHNE